MPGFKIEETKQILKVYISEMPGMVYLECGVLTVEGIPTVKFFWFCSSTKLQYA